MSLKVVFMLGAGAVKGEDDQQQWKDFYSGNAFLKLCIISLKKGGDVSIDCQLGNVVSSSSKNTLRNACLAIECTER